MLNIVLVLYFTSTVGNIILQYVDFSLGLHENYIFQWPFGVNFKKLNIFIKCFAFCEISFEFRENFNFVFRKNFAKLKENFAKHEIDNFAKFSQNTKTKIFAATLGQLTHKKGASALTN